MRNAFCQALIEISGDRELVFLTGDLGFKALEPLREVLGNRFINAGVAEQNMVSVAAGMARAGLRRWAYSIAPFMYARPFEQIRNDVSLHDLPVKLVGNGGGYGYGVMGATHHALEDYGSLLCLANMHAFVPAFGTDISSVVRRLQQFPHPAYLRLGLSELPKGMLGPVYAPWRRLMNGGGATLLVVGPLVGGIWEALKEQDEGRRPSLWTVCELPIEEIPEDFLVDLRRSEHLMVVEEHVAQGGAGQMMARRLLEMGRAPRRFVQRNALGYVSGLYGSQKFHRRECGLDPQSVIAELMV